MEIYTEIEKGNAISLNSMILELKGCVGMARASLKEIQCVSEVNRLPNLISKLEDTIDVASKLVRSISRERKKLKNSGFSPEQVLAILKHLGIEQEENDSEAIDLI